MVFVYIHRIYPILITITCVHALANIWFSLRVAWQSIQKLTIGKVFTLLKTLIFLFSFAISNETESILCDKPETLLSDILVELEVLERLENTDELLDDYSLNDIWNRAIKLSHRYCTLVNNWKSQQLRFLEAFKNVASIIVKLCRKKMETILNKTKDSANFSQTDCIYSWCLHLQKFCSNLPSIDLDCFADFAYAYQECFLMLKSSL